MLMRVFALLGLFVFPSMGLADGSRAGPAEPTVYGPVCRLQSCWAIVLDAGGQATVVEARGYIRARRLAEQAAEDVRARAMAGAGAVQACSRPVEQVNL